MDISAVSNVSKNEIAQKAPPARDEEKLEAKKEDLKVEEKRSEVRNPESSFQATA